jgi:DNA-binding NarL/FixJ family response regulator
MPTVVAKRSGEGMKRASVLLADDHLVVVQGIIEMIRTACDIAGVATDGRELVTMAKQFRPDVIVTDISMPGLNGIDAARIIRRELASVRVVFLTMHQDLFLIQEAFRAGASGYVLKTCAVDELLTAIRFATAGRKYVTPLLSAGMASRLVRPRPQEKANANLTARQREVLQLIAQGKIMKEVAAQLGISARTAEAHKYEIMRHLGVDTVAGLVRYAVQISLV